MVTKSTRRRLRLGIASYLLDPLEDRRLLSAYACTDLGTLGGIRSQANDINNLGQIVGKAFDSAGHEHAFRWQAGAMSDLGTLGGTTSEAVAINSVGQVVGVAAVGTSAATDAFIWQGGVMTDLGLGDQSAPSGINDSGQVAVNANSRAMVWQNGSATDLGALGSSGASAADINNAGQIVGTSQTGATGGFGLPVSHAFVWQNGAMTDVGTPPGTLANYPASINSTGKIAGSYSIILNTGYGAAVIARPVVMDGGTMTYLPTPSNATSLAADINSSGTVVGYNGYGAFIFDHGTLTDLNTLIPPMPGVRLAGATAINDLGQIVGWTSGSQSHAFLLTPNIKAIPMNPDSIARLSAPRMSLDVLMANGGSSVLS